MNDDGLRVKSGALIAHRLLDVAFAIDLKRAESLWLAREGRESRRTKLAKHPRRLALRYRNGRSSGPGPMRRAA
jgi:hypothetical protein